MSNCIYAWRCLWLLSWYSGGAQTLFWSQITLSVESNVEGVTRRGALNCLLPQGKSY